MKKKETKFKEKVLADLRTIPDSWGFKTQEVARRGIPDVLWCIRGRFVSIELKNDGEKPSVLQNLILSKIRRAHGISLYSTPSQWETHFQMLRSI